MLHELLFALNGHTGFIFRADQTGSIKVTQALPFIHPSEASLLNEFCVLGTYCRKIRSFITQHRGFLSAAEENSDGLKRGVYLRALCDGIEQTLNAYCERIIVVEKELLNDQDLSLAFVRSKLEEFFPILGALDDLVSSIISLEAHGCYLVEILHRNTFRGQVEVAAVLKKILKRCCQVLFRQMMAWAVYGLLDDQYSEFFIQSEGEKEDTSGGFQGKQRFGLRPAMLPSSLPLCIAERLLFVGESLHLLQGQAIIGDREDEFRARFLQLDELESPALGTLVDDMHACVSEHLWRLVLEEHDVLAELRLLRDTYLLGRGELFLTFFDRARILLQGPPRATTQFDVNVALQQAARGMLDEEPLRRFQLQIEMGHRDGWRALRLSYQVRWPLQLVFGTEVIDKLQQLFRFLLSMRRVQFELHRCWRIAMAQKERLLLHQLLFFIDTLYGYMQTDVVESHVTQLIQQMKETRDLDTIRQAVENFATGLVRQSFLTLTPIHDGLQELFDLLLLFCTCLERSSGKPLKELVEKIQRQISFLFDSLSTVKPFFPDVSWNWLLLRIDFNKFISAHHGMDSNFIESNK